jgi:two-component system, cell cycle response regulator
MTARVLVVDDMLSNVRLLEAKLSAEYFEVITATNGVEALEAMASQRPDIVLLDIMMPGIDGLEVCRRMKSNPATQHVPVILVTALDQPEDRVRGLEAGADDFLTKPVNDLALFCRVKSLVRLKMLTDELSHRSPNGFALAKHSVDPVSDAPGRVLIVDNRSNLIERIRSTVADGHQLSLAEDPQQAVFRVAEGNFELVIINLDLENFDGLRLCSQLRSLERTRQVPILIIVDPDDNQRLLRALDMGVNDYLLRPVDKLELLARMKTQIKRWRYTEMLRNNVLQTLELALTDPLTGFYNRRFLDAQVQPLAARTLEQGRPMSLLVLDVDHFKRVNDTYGHAAGDRVLVDVAERIRRSVRGNDFPCRIGGEEFVVALPDANIELAAKVAERIRKAISAKPMASGIPGGHLAITISIGVATCDMAERSIDGAMKRADEALYRAKREGRNRVIAAAA